MNMISDKFTNKMIANTFDTDYRAETIAVSLIQQNVDAEQIHIVRDGMARRGVAKDVEKIYEVYSDYDLLDFIYIHINRESIYDMLPQGVFHQPIKRDVGKDKEDILDEIKVHRQEEFFARKFFHLFELIADRTITEAYLFERLYDKKTSCSEFTNLFIQYFPILQMLTLKQSVSFMYIIPILHRIRIHYKNTEQALSSILDLPVKIKKIKLPAKQTENLFESSLKNNRMGVDMVLGNQFDDGVYDLKLIIGPIPAKVMKDYLETAKGYKVLEALCDIFFPANLFVVKDFKISSEDSIFTLSDDKNETYLGINSFI